MKTLNRYFYPGQESFTILESIMALLATLVFMAIPLIPITILINTL
ncbi:hypothetical protein [Maribacter polysaccharolyticus]|nr:hypothetical protein [Maribacter polysaccharolyticus]MDE3744070.1 hypothetical protein [Maribacter polysaccharolyticus]